MSPRRPHAPPARWSRIHSTRLHVVLYSMLLVATPFILLQNFLVEAISHASRSTIALGGLTIPIVPVVGVVVAAGLLICFRALVTARLFIALAIVLLMNVLAQQVTDYYFGHSFHDLQQNWHYGAYAVFALMVYRDLTPRGYSLARIMLITYLVALSFSCFDEIFQMRLSNRVFDISDIAKDVWGTLMGIILVSLGGSQWRSLLADWRKCRHPSLRGYLEHPFSLLVLMMVLAFLLLCISSLLSDLVHWPLVILITLGSFLLFFVLFHISQHKWGGRAILAVIVLGLMTQSYFWFRYRTDYIVHNQYGLTVYKGIAIPFFDVLILPDGSFRLVDKKQYFNRRDQGFFLKHKPDIILIGSGAGGAGGRGFPKKTVSQFLYNVYTQRATQVIILSTPEACRVFNRLKREQKNVLFVLHNTG